MTWFCTWVSHQPLKSQFLHFSDLSIFYLHLKSHWLVSNGIHVIKCKTVRYINNQNSTRLYGSPHLAQKLFRCTHSQLALLADIHRDCTVVQSRLCTCLGEWDLHPEVVSRMWKFGTRRWTVLFKLTCYQMWFSLVEPASLLGQDALAPDWPWHLLYTLPSWPMVLFTLHRIQHMGHRLLVVTLRYPSEAFVPP